MEMLKKGMASIWGVVGAFLILLKPIWLIIENISNLDFVRTNWKYVANFIESGWGTFASILLGAIILGTAILRANQEKVKKLENKLTDLRLSFPGNGRTPTPERNNNVFRWYALSNIIQLVDPISGNSHSIISWTLFIVFDDPINVKFLHLNQSIADFPNYEVKDVGQRHAIITINGDFNGIITIVAEQ